MKKISCILLSILVLVSLLSGCNKPDNNKPEEKPGKADEVIAVTEMEQFKRPQQGDTVAEIVVRDYGSIYVRFFAAAAPKAVENFLTHAKEGYYDGVLFHRILDNFMIQGGDPTGTGAGGESIWGKSFEDEFTEELQPYRGALCMANAGPGTNGSQFFLVQTGQTYDDATLDQVTARYKVEFDTQARKAYHEAGGTPWLYKLHTVFGQIYQGYEVLDAIAGVEMKDARSGIPAKEVVIETIKITEYSS